MGAMILVSFWYGCGAPHVDSTHEKEEKSSQNGENLIIYGNHVGHGENEYEKQNSHEERDAREHGNKVFHTFLSVRGSEDELFTAYDVWGYCQYSGWRVGRWYIIDIWK